MRGYRLTALTISTSIFMQFHDATALNTAVPAIAHALQVPVLHMDIAILAYQIVLVAFVPAGTVVAGRIGARNAFALALAIFMTGSLICSASQSLTMLACARAFQGIGGAVMMPIGRLIVVRSADKSELISAMNWLLVPGVLGPMFGPAVGGFIVQYSSWHWIFLINVPIALLGIVMTFVAVPDIREEKVDRFDRKGALTLSPFLICFVLGLGGVTGRQPFWLSAAMLVASVFFGLAYYRHARTADTPILDLSLLRVPSFRHSILAGTFMRMTFGGTGFVLPLWFQLAMHKSASQSGLLLIMTSFGALLARLVSSPLLRYLHPRSLAVYGCVAYVIILFVNSGLQPDWPQPVFMLLLMLQGLTMSIGLLVVAPATYVDLGNERMAAATTFYATVQQLTMSLGVIAGVWSITGMRWLTGATPHDNLAYKGSMLALAGLALIATMIVRRLDAETVGSLKPQPRPA
jgi:EmrB/QacA subfamily drug resistance transporter